MMEHYPLMSRDQTGRPPSWVRLASAVLAAALVIAACSSGPEASGPGPDPGPGPGDPSDGAQPAEPADGRAPADTTVAGSGEARAEQPALSANGARSSSGIRFGLAVPGSDPATLAEIEAEAGARVGIVRVFTRWDTPFPGPNHQVMLDEGRQIHLSVRPRTDAGVVIPWAEIAQAQPGSQVHTDLQRWLDVIAQYGSQIYFTLNHEPETRDSAGNGEAEEYVAAWRTMVEMLRQTEPHGDEVRTVIVLTRGAYARGGVHDWYPGDDVVDVIGVDPYNWYLCQGSRRDWQDPESLLAPALAFAAERGKPLAVPEIASTEDPTDAGRKADWVHQLGQYLNSGELAAPIEFVAWFNVHDRSWPNCNWAYNSTPDSAQAVTDLIAFFSEAP